MNQIREFNFKYLRQSGFTLVEVLVALVIVSVAVLSLGGFSLSVVGSGQVDRERLTAIHLAEQVMESWQQDPNNFAPIISSVCVFTPGSIPTYPITKTCVPSSGVSINYTIIMDRVRATAPLPTNPNGNSSNIGSFSVRAMLGGTITAPDLKSVRVSWGNKGKTRFVGLTSLVIPR